jgi:hypothetical protein
VPTLADSKLFELVQVDDVIEEVQEKHKIPVALTAYPGFVRVTVNGYRD